jgi:hypothetical protein
LDSIRVYTTEQLKIGNIEQCQSFLVFKNNSELKISDNLNKDRKEIINILNRVLKRNKIEIIK